MKRMLMVALVAFGTSCVPLKPDTDTPQTTVAGYEIAQESELRSIPKSYIDSARTTLRVSYNHTSHGTHVTYGCNGLEHYKTGDEALFAVTNNPSDTGMLFIHDQGGDLSVEGDGDWASWRDIVRNYLDDPANSTINVVMWSWCNIAGHDVPSYLSSMETLIGEYGSGGSKIGSGAGQRALAVTFIFMTGHANGGADNLGSGNPKEQAKLITDYCAAHGYYCVDYWSIDTHAMNGTYYEDANDDAESATYGGNFYQDWQVAHTEGDDWFYNLDSPDGSVRCGEHNTQHITANRKAYAFWYILARIAGFKG